MGEGIWLLGDLGLLLMGGLRTSVLRRGSGSLKVSKSVFPNPRKRHSRLFRDTQPTDLVPSQEEFLPSAGA